MTISRAVWIAASLGWWRAKVLLVRDLQQRAQKYVFALGILALLAGICGGTLFFVVAAEVDPLRDRLASEMSLRPQPKDVKASFPTLIVGKEAFTDHRTSLTRLRSRLR